MAGKTFHGIGDIEDEVPPLGPEGAAPDTPETSDVRGVYSGPTVVDDDKVAAGLERLRALEMPPEAAEVVELVADSSSSEPTKIGQPFMARPTAVGRSMGNETSSPETSIPNDPLRGTMFGHTVHLPDLHAPVDSEDISSSGPIYVPPPATPSQPPPATTQMVRYQDRPRPFAGSTPFPRNAQPFPLAEVFPPQERDLRTETIPPMSRQPAVRVVAGVIALAALGVGAYAWMRSRATAEEDSIPTMPVAPPAIGIEQPAAPPPAVPTTVEPAVPPAPAAATAPAPEAAIAPPPAAVAPVRPVPARSDGAAERRRSSRSERRRSGSADATTATDSDTPTPPPAPKPRRKPVLEEDPDATLPPSLVE
jgi:hypothetical protein